jgi:hypothetical protein
MDNKLEQGSFTKSGRISTFDLLVMTSSGHLIYVLLIVFFTKQDTLMRRWTVKKYSILIINYGSKTFYNIGPRSY